MIKKNEYKFKLMREQDLAENASHRLPICLCIDTSDSMMTVVRGAGNRTGRTVEVEGKTMYVVDSGETRMDDVNSGIRTFYRSIMDDDYAIDIIELSVVTFNEEANCEVNFIGMEKQPDLGNVSLEAHGNRSEIGKGVKLALEVIKNRVDEYIKAGVKYYRPWLIIMTDAEYTTSNSNVIENNSAARDTRGMENKKSLVVFPVCTEDSSGDSLRPFSKNPLFSFDQADFKTFFRLLTDSAKRFVTNSTPGAEDIDLEAVFKAMPKKKG